MMKFALLLCLFVFSAWAQDPIAYLEKFDRNIHSLKTKGVKDFVVDIESSKLTRQLNEQMIFGQVKQVIFRTYWTANPERISIEVIGLPDGFREIKEELKLSILSIMDNLLPIPMANRFAGYKFTSGPGPKEFTAQDTTGIAAIPVYVLKFDGQDKLVEILAKKNVGTLVITTKYDKEGFSDARWVLKSQDSLNSENGQSLKVTKELDYGTAHGIGVLTSLEIRTEQKADATGAKSLILEEGFTFKNYKINTGEAMKYFLGSASKETP